MNCISLNKYSSVGSSGLFWDDTIKSDVNATCELMTTDAGKSSFIVDASRVVKTRARLTEVAWSSTAIFARPAQLTTADELAFFNHTLSLQQHQ